MRALLILFLLTASAFGQQTTEQQVLGTTIGQLFQENARLAVALQQAQAKIKELENAQQKPSPSPTDGGSGTQPSIR